jgi:CO/xanthine dehydrogenase FAD-binding subunit
VGDLLSLKARKPEVEIFAGGTHLLRDKRAKYPQLPRDLAVIGNVDELKRIHRTERYLEVGASVTLSKISSIGGSIVPQILIEAINSMGNPALLNLATIGGNICIEELRSTLFPVLFVLDARVELRQLGGSRWLSINRLARNDGSLDLGPAEVLTRVRIPLGDWNIYSFRRIPGSGTVDEWSLAFCGLAGTDRGVLSDLRFAFGSLGRQLLRNREIEAELVSRKLPLADRERDAVCQVFDEWLEAGYSALISRYQVTMAGKLLRWFLSTLEPR